MIRTNRIRWPGGALAVCLLSVLAWQGAAAQNTTGMIRGHVKDQNGAPLAAAEVQARNVGTGVLRTATTKENGAYALPGLVPGIYELTARHIGNSPRTLRVEVQIGATQLADFSLPTGAIQVQGVTVTAAAPALETRTSELATVVTPQQIRQLPTPSRNFLDLASLAPGVTVSPDRVDLSSNTVSPRNFSSGAQGPGQVNVFIDGVSLKNDLTGGNSQYSSGIVGQDNSRGNPFPRNAIQEYRVITQNFKAEYQQASSAIITATTRSGTNTWTGDAFFNYQNQGLVALDTFQRATPNFTKPDYSRYLGGADIGGPLIRNKLFFFGSYEGNYQNRAATVSITPPTGYAALDTVPFSSYDGNFQSPFRETLLFGKLNYEASPHSSFELSGNARIEHGIRDFGGIRSFQSAVNYRNSVAIGTLKHSYFTGPWLNETTLSYTRFRRNPIADNLNIPQRQYGFAELGSYESQQDYIQRGIAFRDDITYTGFHAAGDHVIKGGVTLNHQTYHIFKANNELPQFFYGDSVNCNPNCTGNVSYAYQSPYKMVWAAGNPLVNTNNNQLGAYLQDDWAPTSRLMLNLGIRWDYESHMLNYNYVTPQAVIDTITKYNSELQHPIDPNEYFTNGHQRKPFLGAFQPRLGFSYALDQDNKTTLFGGAGIYYDRSFFDLSVDEMLKLTHPTYTVYFASPGSTPGTGQVAWDNSYLTTNPTVLNGLVASGQAGLGEVWLIGNHTKPPRSTQFTLGIRRLFGNYLVSVAYAGVRGVNGLVFNWANFAWNNFGTDSSSCCAGTSPFHGYQNILYTTNSVKTWYDALQVQVRRPYLRTGKIGWGAGLSVNYAKRSLQGIDNPNDEFAFPQAIFIPKHPTNDEKVRVVGNWTMDVPYLYGVQFSGLLTLGSGPRQDIAGRFNPSQWVPGGFTPTHYAFIVGKWWAYRDLDLRLSKDFPSISGHTVGVTVDLFNALNFQNLGCYDTGAPGASSFGTAHCVTQDGRRLEVGANYHF